MVEESKNQEGREKELQELDRIAKMLVRRDLELMEVREKREKELQELDRIAKMLVRRDLELMEVREKREKELQELKETRSALINMLEDVEAARLKAEDEKNKTSALIANFTDGLLFFDKENRVFLINPRTEDFLKVKAKDVIGKPLSDLVKISNFEKLADVLSWLNPKNATKEVFRKELSLKKNLVLEISIVSITRDKERMGKLVILHDITREKRIENMKTEFVSIAAHQLRTPLSAIKWILIMLLDQEFGRIPKDQIDILKKAYQSNERMIALVNDLLDVARIEEGRYLYEPVLAEIEPLVQSVIDSQEGKFSEKNLHLKFKKPKLVLPRVRMDVAKMKLVIQNLLDNALQYTPVGGDVTISLKQVNMAVEFSVKDTGVGISEEEQGRIFTKFFRGEKVIKMETEGSGLGLFITKNIIEAHGGKIWFESKPGLGSAFYFTLPIK